MNDHKSSDDSAKPEGQPRSIVLTFTLPYLALAAVGAAVMVFGWKSIETAFRLPTTTDEILASVVAPLIAAAALLLMSQSLEAWFTSWRQLRGFILQIFGRTSTPALVWLAFISAMGEELLFRGAIQPLLGVFATSLVFGLLHIGPDRRISAWTLWTVVAGIVLGLLYENTGSLIGPIIAHFAVNAISLVGIRRTWLRAAAAGSRNELKKNSSSSSKSASSNPPRES